MKTGKLAAKPGGLNLTLEPVWWKERANPYKLSSDPQTCTCLSTYTQATNPLFKLKKKCNDFIR